MARIKKWIFLFFWISSSVFAVDVKDDAGRTISLSQPANRIISAAPHITELLYALGAQKSIVGVTEYSDYPVLAKQHPRVGNNRFLNIEQILLLKPDLLIVWKGGNPVSQVNRLKQLGISVFYSDINKMSDIASTFERLGILVGKKAKGDEQSRFWIKQLNEFKTRYQNRPLLTFFYQVSERPLYTISGKYIMSEGLRLCGGKNIFSDSKWIAPRIGIEEVITRNPDVVFISHNPGNAQGIHFWQRFKTMKAVKANNLFEVEPDLLERPGPRILEGIKGLCEQLETARKK